MAKVTIILPARNELYLKQTIDDLLAKATGEIKIIVGLDGYWPKAEEISTDDRISYFHEPVPRGMRNIIKIGAGIARTKYIMKLDAHCMVAKGYDEVLQREMKSNWIVVPRRYALDPEKWAIEDRTDRKYPIDAMALSSTLQGVIWPEGNHPDNIHDTPMSQGSCWFMERDYFFKLKLCDEHKWGMFFWEFLEMALKCWPSGGEIKVNKNTWYAHWHKTKGRGYNLPKGERERAERIIKDMAPEIDFIRKKFPTMP